MKLPEQAPSNWTQLLSAEFERYVLFNNSPEGKGFIKKANKEYDYWDKVKYYSLPVGISPEFAWAVLKLSRTSAVKQIPLKDKTDLPFQYWLPDTVLKELSFIDKHNGERLLSDRSDIPKKQKDKYLRSSLMEEAIASSQLEGAATTRKKAKEMLRSNKTPANKSDWMILNNYKTILHLKELAGEPLTPEMIQRIQSTLTEGTLDRIEDSGRFRTAEDQIQVIDSRDVELLFEPPHAGEIKERLQALCSYANQQEEDEFVHPILKAIIIHFWLAYVHPFVDGNGRTARALFYWYLLKHGYWKFEYLAISGAIKESPAQYARAFLYTEMDDRDITYFLVFNLVNIHRAIERFEAYVEEKQQELHSIVKSLRKYPGLNHRQYDLLRHACAHPDTRYTLKTHRVSHDITYETARTDLLDLAKKGFLIKRRQGKEFAFYSAEDLLSKVKEGINDKD